MVCNHITVVAPVVVTIEVRNAQAGSGNYIKVFRNSTFINDTRYQMFYDFTVGDFARFEAVVNTGWTFQKFVSQSGAVSTQNPFTVGVTTSGIITAYFTENISTAGWTCIDNCQNMLQSGGTFATQALCMADPCYVPPPLTCDSIAVNTWKVQNNNPKSNIAVPFIVRSLDPNSGFRIYKRNPLTTDLVLEGTTDSSGCYSGSIPAFPDGTYVFAACWTSIVPGVCYQFGIDVSITWGVKPWGIEVYAMIGIGILGLAYVLGQKAKGSSGGQPLINIGR